MEYLYYIKVFLFVLFLTYLVLEISILYNRYISIIDMKPTVYSFSDISIEHDLCISTDKQ
jgi:hypothetical protein